MTQIQENPQLSKDFLRSDEVLLESTLVLLLLRGRLEGAVSELGRGIDPLEGDLLVGTARGVDEHGLAESDNTLLGAGDGALDHDEVVVDLAVADEATEAGVMLANTFFGETCGTGRTYGVMTFLVTSSSVEALSSAPALAMR